MWSQEAEQAVLGAILTEPRLLDEVSALISERDFYAEKHRVIYSALKEMSLKGEGIDALTVSQYMGKDADEVGGFAYLLSLTQMQATFASASIEAHARLVREKRMRRDLAEAGRLIAHLATDESDWERAISQSERAVSEIAAIHDAKGLTHLGETMLEHWTEIQQSRVQAGLSTGLRSLDLALGGLHRSDLVILAARPGQGKSALAAQIAYAAAREGATVGLFSLEMSAEQIAERLVGGVHGVDMRRLRLRQVPESEWGGIWGTVSQLAPLPIYVDDSGMLSPGQLISRARRLKAKHGLDLLIVDYLQLMQSDSRRENRQQEVTDISKSLKIAARDMDIPVLACAQLSRATEQRANKEPELSDLRESGAIEQDADVVAFLHRTEHDLSKAVFPTDVLVKKHRHGPVGKCSLLFVSQRVRFEMPEVRHEPSSKGRDWGG